MIKESASRKVFVVFNYIFFTLFSISIIVPFLNCIAISFSSYTAVSAGEVGIWPVGWDLQAYSRLVKNIQLWRTFGNTIIITVVNTILTIAIALMTAYALSNKYLIGKGAFMVFFLIPYYFGGGLIPTYLIITQLGLKNNFLVYILPSITSIYYIIVFRNIIAALPKELMESAEIDGATQPRILFSIIIPLIVPTIAAFIVFSAVGNWNTWFSSMVYMDDRKDWLLQYQLREILMGSGMTNVEMESSLADREHQVHSDTTKMAALMITVLPIIIVYPFVQKYFVKGVLVGAVKG